VTAEEIEAMCAARAEAVRVLEFDSRRYVGALIGIHNPDGQKVGKVSHVRNTEYLVCAGAPELLEELCRSQEMSRSSPARRRVSAPSRPHG
jgi:adenine-specific DNA-methyltransferase